MSSIRVKDASNV